MPAKLILRSAMIFEPLVNRTSGELTILHRHNCGSRPARANAIAAGKNPRRSSFKIGIDPNKTFVSFEIEARSERQFILADRLDYLVGGQKHIRTRNLFGSSTPGRVRLAQSDTNALQRLHHAILMMNFDRLG